MKLYRSFVGSRGIERGRISPAGPLQQSHALQTPLPVNIESPWERLQTHFLQHERPLWELAPELRFVQFPWRYAVPLGVAFAFFLGAAAGKFRGLSILAVCVFILAGPLAKILLAIKRPSSWQKAEISRFQGSVDSGRGYRGTPEYLPNGANSKGLEESAAATSEGSDEFAVTNVRVDGNSFFVQPTVPREIAFNLFDYPTWQVDVDGSRVNPKGKDSEGRLAVAVPAGNHLIHIFLQRKWDAKLGIAISIATAVLLLGQTFLAWRLNELSAHRPIPNSRDAW